MSATRTSREMCFYCGLKAFVLSLQETWADKYVSKGGHTPNTITRTSERVISVWRFHELLLCRNISQVHKMSEMCLPKLMNMISTDYHHKLAFSFMPYYYSSDIYFNGLCTILEFTAIT